MCPVTNHDILDPGPLTLTLASYACGPTNSLLGESAGCRMEMGGCIVHPRRLDTTVTQPPIMTQTHSGHLTSQWLKEYLGDQNVVL